MIQTRTKKIGALLGVAIIVAGIGVFEFYQLIQHQLEHISTYQLELQSKFGEQERDRSLRDLIKNSGSDIDHLSTRVIASDGAVGFIEMIENLARERNLTITVDSVTTADAPTNPTQFELLTLSLQTRGGWSNSQHYLSELESLPYAVTIKGVSFSADSQDATKKSSGMWNGATTITVLKKK